MITERRKIEISELAEFISTEYFGTNFIDPTVVANKKGITYSFGNYKHCFDGLLEHSKGNFHIYINLDRLKTESSPRARFTFGHELGHYFIDEHRNALAKGKSPSHGSLNKLQNENIVEKEADLFSSCFLMPSERFKNFCFRKPLSENLIENISEQFQTSVSASIFRYFELNLYPMAIIYSKDGKIGWHMESKDFKFKFFPKRNSAVPSSTVAGEYFYKSQVRKNEETIFPDDWFKDFNINKDEPLTEKCYYLPNNAILSLIWY